MLEITQIILSTYTAFQNLRSWLFDVFRLKFQFFFNEDFRLGLSFLKYLIVKIDHLNFMIRLHSLWLKVNTQCFIHKY